MGHEAWAEYVNWQKKTKTLKRINKLIKSIQRDGLFEGLGKPEPLKGNLADYECAELMTLIDWYMFQKITAPLQSSNARPTIKTLILANKNPSATKRWNPRLILDVTISIYGLFIIKRTVVNQILPGGSSLSKLPSIYFHRYA